MTARTAFQLLFCLLPAGAWAADILVSERLGTNNPAVARQSSGETFFVWDSGFIVGQRLDALGQPLDTMDLDISNPPVRPADLPDVAMNDNGQVVVVWHGWDDNGTDEDILGRLYTFDSLEPSDIFRINLEEEGVQLNAQVVIDESGQFVVVYESHVDGSSNIMMRRFDATGTPLDNGQVVNATGAPNPRQPTLARGPNGQLAVTWIQDPSDSGTTALLRFFDANGTPTSDTIEVADDVLLGAAAITSSGQTLVAWSGDSIFARLFDALGNPLTEAFSIDDPDQMNGGNVDVAALESGDFQVVWERRFTQSGEDIMGRIVSSSGVPIGQPVRMTVTRQGPQREPAMASEGEIAIAFVSPFSGASAVWTTCLTPIGCTEVFLDGFESGDISAWSSATP